MKEEEKSKLADLYNALVMDKHKCQKLIDDIDTVLARILNDLGIDIEKEEKNGYYK